jgi:hypothetical protein
MWHEIPSPKSKARNMDKANTNTRKSIVDTKVVGVVVKAKK